MKTGDYNKVTVVFGYEPGKWVGLEDWQQDIALLMKLARRLGLDYGRSYFTRENEYVTDSDEWFPAQ